MSEIATLQSEVKEYKLQLETVRSGLQADPDNAELQDLKAELEQHQNQFRRQSLLSRRNGLGKTTQLSKAKRPQPRRKMRNPCQISR